MSYSSIPVSSRANFSGKSDHKVGHSIALTRFSTRAGWPRCGEAKDAGGRKKDAEMTAG
jgi:hypothetical protein